eukprot:4704082-Prymnesium_polylepis.1
MPIAACQTLHGARASNCPTLTVSEPLFDEVAHVDLQTRRELDEPLAQRVVRLHAPALRHLDGGALLHEACELVELLAPARVARRRRTHAKIGCRDVG